MRFLKQIIKAFQPYFYNLFLIIKGIFRKIKSTKCQKLENMKIYNEGNKLYLKPLNQVYLSE